MYPGSLNSHLSFLLLLSGGGLRCSRHTKSRSDVSKARNAVVDRQCGGPFWRGEKFDQRTYCFDILPINMYVYMYININININIYIYIEIHTHIFYTITHAHVSPAGAGRREQQQENAKA